MWRTYLSRLHHRALALVLLGVFPLLALMLYSYLDRRGQDILEVQRVGLVVARNLATIHENLITHTHQLLTTLASMPEVQQRHPKDCETLFAGLLAQNPYYTAIEAVDPDGKVFASAPPTPHPVNVADQQWFQKAIRTRTTVIGEPVLGHISNKEVINMAYAFWDEAGRLQGVITAGIDLQWLGNLVARSDFPRPTSITLTDSDGKVLFRYPDPRKYLGQTLPDYLVTAMTVSDEGVAEGIDLPGDERLFAFTRLSAPLQEIRLAIGFPRDWAVDSANRALRRNLIVLALVALLALAAAWYGGDLFVVRPVKKLQAVTERLAAGDLTVRSGSNYTQGELGLLSRSFDQMADSLQLRQEDLRLANEKLQREVQERQRTEAALRDSEARLRWALQGAGSGAWEWDLRTNENFWSAELWSLYGLQPHSVQPSYEAWRQTVHPEDRPKAEAAIQTAVSQGADLEIEWRVLGPDGRNRWLLLRGRPQLDAHGQPARYLGIVVDITRRKEAEEALRQLNAELEQRVAVRTVELQAAVARLEQEISHRRRIAKDLQESRERLRFLAKQLLTSQEQERKHLALELHDELGHALLTLKFSLGDIAQKLPPEQADVKDLLQEQMEHIKNVIQEVRRLYRDLSPGDVENLGLTRALGSLIKDFAGHLPDIAWQVDLPELAGDLSLPVQTVTYRLVQEALTNIGKHAHPTRVTIAAREEDHHLTLVIADDGRGFDLAEVQQDPSRGLGLAAMQERLDSVGGSLEIWSQKGRGTKLTFTIPESLNDAR